MVDARCCLLVETHCVRASRQLDLDPPHASATIFNRHQKFHSETPFWRLQSEQINFLRHGTDMHLMHTSNWQHKMKRRMMTFQVNGTIPDLVSISILTMIQMIVMKTVSVYEDEITLVAALY